MTTLVTSFDLNPLGLVYSNPKYLNAPRGPTILRDPFGAAIGTVGQTIEQRKTLERRALDLLANPVASLPPPPPVPSIIPSITPTPIRVGKRKKKTKKSPPKPTPKPVSLSEAAKLAGVASSAATKGDKKSVTKVLTDAGLKPSEAKAVATVAVDKSGKAIEEEVKAGLGMPSTFKGEGRTLTSTEPKSPKKKKTPEKKTPMKQSKITFRTSKKKVTRKTGGK